MGCLGDSLMLIGFLMLFSPGLPFGILLILLGIFIGGRTKEKGYEHFTGKARPYFSNEYPKRDEPMMLPDVNSGPKVTKEEMEFLS